MNTTTGLTVPECISLYHKLMRDGSYRAHRLAYYPYISVCRLGWMPNFPDASLLALMQNRANAMRYFAPARAEGGL